MCRGSPANNAHEVDSAPGPAREDAPTGTDAQPGHAQEVNAPAGMQGQPHIRDLGPLVGRSSSMSRAITRIGGDTDKPSELALAGVREDDSNGERKVESVAVDKEKNDDGFGLTPEQKRKKEVMQVFLLEMGILFHSVFIGMSLSVTVGSEFVVLLIAIVFHRESFCYPPKTATDRFAQKLSKDSPWALGSRPLIFPGTLSSPGLCPWPMA